MIKLQLFIHQRIINYSVSVGLAFSPLAAANNAPIIDSEQPVTIKSDLATFDNDKGLATYMGHVTVDQGSRHLSSEKLTIQRDEQNRIKVIIATGNPARFHSQSDPTKPVGSGKAKLIKYYPQQDTVDLFENAQITQNGDTISGPVLKYNFLTGNLKSKSTKRERATFTFQPKRES